MGWTFLHRERGQSDREFWQGELDGRYELLGCATVGGALGGTFYAAVRDTEGPQAGQVWALVCLTRWVPRDYHNYGYRDMDERMGPCESGCPARILDLLSPLEVCGPHTEANAGSGYCGTCSAREWRARCREVAEARARAAKVKAGQVVRFARPITFQSGAELDTLTFEKRDMFTADGFRYRVTGWRTMAWELAS